MRTYPLVLDATQRVSDLRVQLSDPEGALPAAALIRSRDGVIVRWHVMRTRAQKARRTRADDDLPLMEAFALTNVSEAQRCDARDLPQNAPDEARTVVTFAGARQPGVTVNHDEERSDMWDADRVEQPTGSSRLDAASWRMRRCMRPTGETASRGIPAPPPPIEPSRPPLTAPPVGPPNVPPDAPPPVGPPIAPPDAPPPVGPPIAPPEAPPQAPEPPMPTLPPSVPAPAPMPRPDAPEATGDAPRPWRPRRNDQKAILDDDGEARVAKPGTLRYGS